MRIPRLLKLWMDVKYMNTSNSNGVCIHIVTSNEGTTRNLENSTEYVFLLSCAWVLRSDLNQFFGPFLMTQCSIMKLHRSQQWCCTTQPPTVDSIFHHVCPRVLNENQKGFMISRPGSGLLCAQRPRQFSSRKRINSMPRASRKIIRGVWMIALINATRRFWRSWRTDYWKHRGAGGSLDQVSPQELELMLKAHGCWHPYCANSHSRRNVAHATTAGAGADPMRQNIWSQGDNPHKNHIVVVCVSGALGRKAVLKRTLRFYRVMSTLPDEIVNTIVVAGTRFFWNSGNSRLFQKWVQDTLEMDHAVYYFLASAWMIVAEQYLLV